jgi:hypothetical protein
MQVGEIYYWDTQKAAGHASRFKYHVFISEPDGIFQDHLFLFISSADYGSDFAISKTDYPFFTNATSYISVGGVIQYSDSELKAAAPQLKGRMTQQHMQDLFNAILKAGKMPGREEKCVCNALKAAF